MSNANPYSHLTYDAQDLRQYYPWYNATLAHYAYAYDTYTGNSSYLEQQQWQNYKRTAGLNTVGCRGRTGVEHGHCRCCSHLRQQR